MWRERKLARLVTRSSARAPIAAPHPNSRRPSLRLQGGHSVKSTQPHSQLSMQAAAALTDLAAATPHSKAASSQRGQEQGPPALLAVSASPALVSPLRIDENMLNEMSDEIESSGAAPVREGQRRRRDRAARERGRRSVGSRGRRVGLELKL